MSPPDRAQTIAAAIPDDARSFVEVGYDRGLVLDAIKTVRPELTAFGVEIQPGAARHVPAELSRQVTLLTGDGLQPIAAGRVDGVVMAGLGARTMLRILAASPDVVARLTWLVLCPSHFEDDLRSGLTALGWYPEDERLVHDRGRYYEVMRARPGDDPSAPDAIAARWGPRLVARPDPLASAWLADLRHRFRAAFAAGLHKAAVGEKLRLIDLVERRVRGESPTSPAPPPTTNDQR